MTPKDRNNIEVLKTWRGEVQVLMDQVRKLDRRLLRLGAKLDDPAMRDDPGYDKAVGKYFHLVFERKVTLERIKHRVEQVVARWYRMSEEAQEEVTMIWGIPAGVKNPDWNIWRKGGLDYHPPRESDMMRERVVPS